MRSAQELREVMCPSRDVGINSNLFVSVVDSLYGVSIDILSFEKLDHPQVAQYLVEHSLAYVPGSVSPHTACVRYGARSISVQHTKKTCAILPLHEAWDTLEVNQIPIGQYTFVVDVVGGRFRIRYKRHQLPGEIGSKHLCMVDDETHLVIAGEISREKSKNMVNLQSGT